LKVTQDRGTPGQFPDVRRVRCQQVPDLLMAERGVIGWGGNGGFHAINLALQFGARDLVLLGYDMTLQHGIHWHGRHAPGLTNPTQASTDKWRINLDAQRPFLDMLGARAVLGSPGSALTAFPTVTLEEALDAAPPNFV
jgi:hypothetical protein